MELKLRSTDFDQRGQPLRSYTLSSRELPPLEPELRREVECGTSICLIGPRGTRTDLVRVSCPQGWEV